MNDMKGPIQRLIDAFESIRGIGPKSAEKYVDFLLNKDRRVAVSLRQALHDALEQVRPCRECFNLTDGGDLCAICSDPRRDGAILCVVESPPNVVQFERTGSFRGLYHVLGGQFDPINGYGVEQLNVNTLLERIRRGGVREVILATSPTIEGDGTALIVSNLLSGSGVAVTKLARGLPAGASLELTNSTILADALDGRRAV